MQSCLLCDRRAWHTCPIFGDGTKGGLDCWGSAPEVRAPKMSRQDFAFIADVLAESRPLADPYMSQEARQVRDAYWCWLVRYAAERLAETNRAFNRDRFYAASGYES